MTTWLQNLKAGDKVIVDNKVTLVARASATLITVDGVRFQRDTGKECNNKFNATYLRECSPREEEWCRRRPLIAAIEVHHYKKYDTLTTSQLTRMAAIAGEARDKDQNEATKSS